MMPVPSHLTDCVVPKDNALDESPLDARVVCPCRSQHFQLLFPGQTHEYAGETVPCTAEIDRRFFFVVKAQCTACKREHLLLDSDFHGWNGLVCHQSQQAALPRPRLIPWKCPSCNETEHEASVQIQTEGKEDFLTETDGDFEAELWPDGFAWFSIAIKCVACGKETPEWVSYETM